MIFSEDEGKYWCRRDDTRQEGEITNIRVAYVDDFPAGTVPIFKPIKPIIGDRVEATCPKVSAVPEPSVVWLLVNIKVVKSVEKMVSKYKDLYH